MEKSKRKMTFGEMCQFALSSNVEEVKTSVNSELERERHLSELSQRNASHIAEATETVIIDHTPEK